MTFQQFPDAVRRRLSSHWQEARGWAAARREFPAVLIQPARMAGLPVDLAGIFSAILLTVLLIASLNAWGSRSIRRAYLEHVPEPLIGATSSAVAADRLIESGWTAAENRDWLAEAIMPGLPTSRLILDVGRYLAATDRAEAPAEVTLRRLALGDPQGGWPPPSGLWRTVSGTELLDSLLRDDPLWRRALEADASGLADAKRAFLAKLCDDLVGATRPAIRNIRRWNGICQWCTLALAWFCIITLGRRAWLLRTLRQTSTAADPDLEAIPRLLQANRNLGARPPEQTMLLQEESNRLTSAIEGRVYEPLGFLNGCLPALGFIGTVVGMGEALLLADSLFGSSDRQKTISLMTEQLGLAFDTTLVALLCGLVVGGLIAWVRRDEQAFLSRFEAALVDRFVDPAGPPGEGLA